MAQAHYHLYFQCKKQPINFYLTKSDFNSKVLGNPCICHNAFAAIFHLSRQKIEMKSNNRNLFILGDFNCHDIPSGAQKVLLTPMWKKYSIGSSSPSSQSSHIRTLLHRSSGRRFSPDVSFAASFHALFCSWKVLQD